MNQPRCSLVLSACLWCSGLGMAACGSDDTGKDSNPYLGTAGTFGVAPTAGTGVKVPAGNAGTTGVNAPSAGRGAVVTPPTAGSLSTAAGSGAAAGSSAGAIAAAGQGAAGAGSAGTGAAVAGQSAAGAAASGSGGSSGETSAFQRPCVSAGKEVVFIGDSYSVYAIAHKSLASFMETLARKDDALGATDTYRNLAVAGTTLAAAPAAIPGQWEGTKAMQPIHAVVMSGGGNDVLISNQQCRPEGSETRMDCQKVVQNSLDAAKTLFTSMQSAGVSDVLYFWYPHIPGGLLTGGEKGTSISDYTYPMLEAVAKAASTDTFHVYTVPTVDIFEGHPEYFYSDGLHANDVGEGKIADAIWKVMKDNCIAQGESSGCCKAE